MALCGVRNVRDIDRNVVDSGSDLPVQAKPKARKR